MPLHQDLMLANYAFEYRERSVWLLCKLNQYRRDALVFNATVYTLMAAYALEHGARKPSLRPRKNCMPCRGWTR